MAMTLRDLITELESLAEEHGDDVMVRLAHQPRWPFEYDIGQVVAVPEGDGDEEDDDANDGAPVVVYIAESTQVGYLPGNASRALGWR